jgi:hypothetical protein
MIMEETEVPNKQQAVADILEQLINVHYDKAKIWTGWILIAQIVIYLAGVAAVFAPKLPLAYPAVALVLVLVNSWLSARATKFQLTAELLKRQHEYWQGFGQPPLPGQLADLRVEMGETLSEEADGLLREGLKYSSGERPGPERVLENLSESAWFSKHLAGWCSDRLSKLFVASAIVAVVILLIVATSLAGNQVGTIIAKCVSSTLTFLVSVGVLNSWLAFGRFQREAASIEAEAQRLLKHGTVVPFEAQRLLSEYQLLRASAPMIPTWVWTTRRRALNQTWDELKRSTK